MVVLSIIFILAALIVPALQHARKSEQERRMLENQSSPTYPANIGLRVGDKVDIPSLSKSGVINKIHGDYVDVILVDDPHNPLKDINQALLRKTYNYEFNK